MSRTRRISRSLSCFIEAQTCSSIGSLVLVHCFSHQCRLIPLAFSGAMLHQA